MNKLFFDVFPQLKISEDLRGRLERTEVSRMCASSDRRYMRVYILSDSIIEKDYIRKAETELKKQYFGGNDMAVRICERFNLPGVYTPANLMELYNDSILQEFYDYDRVEYTLLRNGEFLFPEENRMTVRITDGMIARQKAADIISILDKILNVRCGLTVKLELEYVAPKKEPREEEPWISPAENEAPQESKAAPAPSAGADNGKNGKETAASDTAAMTVKAGVTAAAETKNDAAPDKPASRSGRRMRDPDVIYGREVPDEASPLSAFTGDMGEVTVQGQIMSVREQELKSGKILMIFEMTDYTDSVSVKLFLKPEIAETLRQELVERACVRVRGIGSIDGFDKEPCLINISGIKKIPEIRKARKDTAAVKRVELHLHTKMSNMDGVSEASDMVSQAYKWGMPGIAITDHGVVQALTEAGHTWDKLFDKEKERRKAANEPPIDRQAFFKVIPGMEGYLVDDLKETVRGRETGSFTDRPVVVFDIETTGFSPTKNRIIEIGAVKIEDGRITDRFSEFINPGVPIPYRITELTSITDSMVADAPPREEIIPEFMRFCEGSLLAGHNVGFDMSFIEQNCDDLGIEHDLTSIDTMGLARTLLPGHARYTLDAVAKLLGVSLEHHHRAVDDAECTAGIWLKLLPYLEEKDVHTLDGMRAMMKTTKETVRGLHAYHVILLAKNTTGRVNLYTLVSESHLNYFHRYPLIPKSLLVKYREGLIVGSACCAGELFGALVEGRPDNEIDRLVRFYDYLEIQPVDNNRFMIGNERYEDIRSEEDIKNINRRIVELGNRYQKPVIATCDAHFLDPEDGVFREVILSGKGMDGEEPAPLYVRTTDEMLEEFSYLGEEKSKEVVVDNSRLILSMCDSISPVRPDKCPPVIPHSDEILTRICNERAHEIYGDKLPEVVQERMDRELHSIISNGFAVMYIIAQKLVWKSVEDGYLVGSRGSVGSSFVAFLAGITEVNSLQPHYVCPKCRYSDFDSEEVKSFGGRSGCDMPDRICPVCGEKLYKDGFDIPFETFLGFKGDKEPDIDLNFSGEYQSKAHKYTEVIFGYGQTYRAGTIAALAEKTAYGFAKKYCENTGEIKRKAEMNRLSHGCEGVRTGTGQHPGGIIVLPVGEDINSFTPVQHPANKDVATITTHYDYHSIDHNLLKLDILGHDDPTMIRFLQDVTGIDPVRVPLDDTKVMSLFMNTESLGITPEQIGGTKLGCLGIPEFGTDFAMQMVIDAKPTSFSHLIRISGLSHGTDVWLGNAQALIQEGKATIDTAICTRDDIMIYLIQKGMDKSLAFKTMESVRKGKGLKPEMEEAMIAADVPDWYIWSCKKIKYMFPKAHAAAYVMMAWRIAWFKVYRPAAFYSAWFSIRAKAFNYEDMCQGEEHLHDMMKKLKEAEASRGLSDVEAKEYADMRVAEEMYERGISFVKIDLFQVLSRSCRLLDDTRIMPPLTSITGLGEKVADQIVEAASDGAFISKDDFRNRTHCGQTICDRLDSLGLLGDIPESDQISLFDFIAG